MTIYVLVVMAFSLHEGPTTIETIEFLKENACTETMEFMNKQSTPEARIVAACIEDFRGG